MSSGGDEGETDGWSNLPVDLLARISKLFETRMEFGIFRAVCPRWRSSNLPFPVIKIPYLYSPDLAVCLRKPLSEKEPIHVAGRHVIYGVELPSSSERFLLRVAEDEKATHLLTPLSCIAIKHRAPFPLPPWLNLLEVRPCEIFRDYYAPAGFFRAVSTSGRDYDEAIVVALDGCRPRIAAGPLYFFKTGEWTMLDRKQEWYWYSGNRPEREDDLDFEKSFMDVTFYKAKFLALKDDGSVLRIDPCSKQVSEFARPIDDDSGFSIRRVVYSYSLGCLLLVDIKYFYTDLTYEFAGLYKLNEEEHKWVCIQSLGDQALFLSQNSSFSVSCATDFVGYKNNCIYFYNEHYGDRIIFNLEDNTQTQKWDAPF